MSRLALLAACASLAAPAREDGGGAGEWPCWRGPRGDNVSLESGWRSAGKDADLWRRDVGLGHSSCALAGGRLYTLGFVAAEGADHLWCLDAESGAVVWTRAWPAEQAAESHGGGTLTTPALAGGRAWVMDRTGVLRCFDAAGGAPLHERDLCREFGVQPTIYGFGGSPLVGGGLVVVHAGKALAFDEGTGEPRWSTRDFAALYSTPAPFTLGGRAALACFGREGLLVLERASGAELQAFPWRKGETTVNAATPVIAGERVFISSGYDHGCALVDFAGDEPRALFESKVMRTQLSGAVLLAEHLYGFDEAQLKCIDLAGQERWRKRGLGQGALTIAGDRLILTSEKGELVIVQATSERYAELSRKKLFETGTFWSSPVLSKGLIYVRSSQGELVCRDHR